MQVWAAAPLRQGQQQATHTHTHTHVAGPPARLFDVGIVTLSAAGMPRDPTCRRHPTPPPPPPMRTNKHACTHALTHTRLGHQPCPRRPRPRPAQTQTPPPPPPHVRQVCINDGFWRTLCALEGSLGIAGRCGRRRGRGRRCRGRSASAVRRGVGEGFRGRGFLPWPCAYYRTTVLLLSPPCACVSRGPQERPRCHHGVPGRRRAPAGAQQGCHGRAGAGD